MDSLSSRITGIAPSATLAVTNQAKAMKANGEQVFGLAGGEPDYDTPDHIKAAAVKALTEGKTKYTPAAGLPELREAVAAKLLENELEYTAAQVSINCGAKHSCYNAILAVVEEGDEVIIPAPYWVSYPDMVRAAGGVPVIVQTKQENGWKMTAEEFEENMSPATKMVIINSPGNPTGAVYSRDELTALGEVAVEEEIVILSDEIYEKLLYNDAEHVSIASISKEIYALTITIGGWSKAYSMTGWRLGWTAGPHDFIKAINTIQGHTTSNPCTFSQFGGIAALEGDQSFVEDLRNEYDVRRQFMKSRLEAIPNISFVEPEGAFYFWVNTEQLGLTSSNLCDKLLNRYKVAAVPGAAFGVDNGIRLSYCTTLDVLNEGMDRFEQFCREH